jgi:hypothetical protein
MSPPCTKMSASGSRGPCGGGLHLRSARRRRPAAISAAGSCARRRANSSIARPVFPLRRMASFTMPGRPSVSRQRMCAATVFTSHPAHRLGIANCASSRSSIRSAMRRRSRAVAANTCSRSTVEAYGLMPRPPRQMTRYVIQTRRHRCGAVRVTFANLRSFAWTLADLAGPSSLPVKLADVLVLPAANRPPNRPITPLILPRRYETIPRCGTQAGTFFHPTAVANECGLVTENACSAASIQL